VGAAWWLEERSISISIKVSIDGYASVGVNQLRDRDVSDIGKGIVKRPAGKGG
jgi:hypothetical protein